MRRLICIVPVLVAMIAGGAAAAGAASAPEWPGESWPLLAEIDPAAHDLLLGRPACRDGFIPYATAHADEPDGLKTDGLVIVRDGLIVFERYDGEYDRDTPHYLWSASKSVTATILGAAIQQGARLPSGEPLTLATPVHHIYPPALRPPAVRNAHEANYLAITLGHLLAMTAGMRWEESYESDVTESSFLPMLYMDGQRNMPLYAIRQPMLPDRPGTRWLYSGGNINIVMGVLERVYGDRYASLPWDLLFTPLGMRFDPAHGIGPVVERDGSGHFVGSSYVHMTPRDMARLGYLYLKDGVWQGGRILPAGWVRAARTLNRAQTNLQLGPDYVAYIDREGIFSERTFWLNLEVPGLKIQFPNAPRDMFFAAGHYGQLIVILPSHGMVIARTGHDAEYWSKIDAFVAKAVACFRDDR